MLELVKSRSHELGLERFTVLTDFEVDGIVYRNPRFVYDKLMFEFKDELDVDGDPADTGGLSYRHNPNVVMSDDHWLSCALMVPVGEYCVACGEQAKE